MTQQHPAATTTPFVLIRSAVSGREWRVEAGVEARMSRDAAADVPLVHPRVSRTAHALLTWVHDQAFLVEDGPGRAVFADGVRTSRLPVTDQVSVRLGSAADGEDLDLSLVRPARESVPTGGHAVRGRHRAPTGGLPSRDGTPATPARDADPGVTRVAGVLPALPGQPDRTPGPPLVVSCGSSTTTLRGVPHRVHTVGRAMDSDVAVEDPRVSRRHLEAVWDGTRWLVTDRSASGTFGADLRPLPPGRPVPVPGSLVVRLGHPVDGEPATLTVAGHKAAEPTLRRGLLAGVVALVLALLAGVVAVTLVGRRTEAVAADAPGDPTRLSESRLATAEKSTVRLTMMTGSHASAGWGSGTIVSPDGLILTNAHVADPTAHGLAAQYGFANRRSAADHVKYLLVGVDAGRGAPVHDRYRARVQVVDGYVDLAVVKVYANADGSPLTGTLHLPAATVGDSDAMQPGDQLTVLGFPGVADSDTVTVNTGEVAGLSRDPHMHSRRAFFDSSATVRAGNSGGSAVNAAGELVGVPTQHRSTAEGDSSYRVRPVRFAAPLLARARVGADPEYVSPYLAEPTGHESVRFLGVTDDATKVCTGTGTSALPTGTSHFWSSFAVTHAARHLDLYPAVGQDDDGKLDVKYVGNPTTPAEGTCAFVEVDADQPLTDGTYEAAVLTGPDADALLGDATAFTVGDDATGSQGGGTEGDTSAAQTLHAAFPGTSDPAWGCVAVTKAPEGAAYGEQCSLPADTSVSTRFLQWTSVDAEGTFLKSLRGYVAEHGTSLTDSTWKIGDTPCGSLVVARWNDGTVTLFGFYDRSPFSFVVEAPTEKAAMAAFASQAFPLLTPDRLPAPTS